MKANKNIKSKNLRDEYPSTFEDLRKINVTMKYLNPKLQKHGNSVNPSDL